MKIAFVSTILHYPWGGADTLWTHAAEAASRRGDALQIFVSPVVARHERIVALASRGAAIHERAAPEPPAGTAARVRRRLGRMFARADPVAVALRAFRPDLVVFSLGGTYDLIAHAGWIDWLLASRTRYRIVANWQQENPVLSDREHELAVRALTGADVLAFVSTRNLENTRRHLLRELPNAHLFQNPLRWQSTDVSPWPEAPAPVLATVSRLEEGKGIQLLLHALAAIRGEVPEFRLNIYGRGRAEAYLRRVVDFVGLTPVVAFRGYVPELRPIWSDNQLLVSPAIDDGVPMTIPEAMLCARPVLATAVGGAEDWLRDGESGLVCPAPTLPLLAATLRLAFAAHARWPAMGIAAADSAQARYRPDDHLRLIN